MIEVICNEAHVLPLICKAKNKWGIFVSFCLSDDEDITECLKAMPLVKDFYVSDRIDFLCDGGGYLLFDSQQECENWYWSVVGDDGPTKTNSYNGPFRAYALLCSPEGVLLNENT